MTKEIILITEFKKKHFIFLCKCYDETFKIILKAEILDIKFKWHLIKDHLDTEHLKIIKADYQYIDDVAADEEPEEEDPEEEERQKLI